MRFQTVFALTLAAIVQMPQLRARAHERTEETATSITVRKPGEVGPWEIGESGKPVRRNNYQIVPDPARKFVGSGQVRTVVSSLTRACVALGVVASLGTAGLVQTYATTFKDPEDPLSEGGKWSNNGLDWTSIRKSGGIAYSTQTGTETGAKKFNDSYAILSGFPPDQEAWGKAYIAHPSTKYYQEIEILLRFTSSPHRTTGYECFARCIADRSSYLNIVRWDGPLGKFTYLAQVNGADCGLKSGDTLKASIIGNVITVYINGIKKAQVTDDTFQTGNPGIGMFLACNGRQGIGTNTDFGLTSFSARGIGGARPDDVEKTDQTIRASIPTLNTDNATINEAFRIAIGDLMGNVVPCKDGLLDKPVPVILAGLDYNTPWTRDASINAWNGASLIIPEVARNTLLSVLTRSNGKVRIGGQYWDCIVWTTGAWNHYLYAGDREFLALALDATRNSLTYFEQTEFDANDNLFRGPAWSDGIAAYPDEYADAGGSSGILDWPKHNPGKVSKPGYGIPMKALSTNCLFYNAYVTAGKIALELKASVDPQWEVKAANLKQAINTRLWNEATGCYRVLVGPLGNCDQQEGLGSSYALLFGIAEGARADSVFSHQHVTPAGLPCGWPNLPRYESKDGMSFGRHIGTVWPQIQGFWADAAARAGHSKVFAHELFNLSAHAARDKQFAEIYHPITGRIYGGLQENGGKGIILWQATSRQTWAATAYLRMVFLGLAGLRVETAGVRFQPCLPNGVSFVELRNLAYRRMTLDVTVRGNGTRVKRLLINGQEVKDGLLGAAGEGRKQVTIVVGDR
ncbi:MAG: hypothetical protein ABSG53_24010 [Thermoguttaceae bacterium]|jgi:hypothetical protein